MTPEDIVEGQKLFAVYILQSEKYQTEKVEVIKVSTYFIYVKDEHGHLARYIKKKSFPLQYDIGLSAWFNKVYLTDNKNQAKLWEHCAK
ncbi:hypothetical protein IV64_GL001710 [Lactiplantibacillus xiangfangensis]|uniref:Uncharacterized protein n=1 Tax=Lactiplantibacillus xiangfangensis TaxID=942150 RepID=A0A0R2MPM6_9LACO|nr:hypothetical protein [Lactiplantibacillus xiangfangensis]KRO14226.1 hypothetical protein IV64_GL001710 [Lactiplantibacillus xiangfangensis]